MHNIKYYQNRRPRNFLHRKVRDVLPEFFTQDYPNLVTFLEKYYDYLDSDDASSFGNQLKQIYQTRDTQETPENLLSNLISEIAAGNTGDKFIDPNFYAQRIHELHRTKGSRFSIEEFFRAFFHENVEIEYPKNNIFTIGHDSAGPLSRIGAESNKFIRNNALYQVFSILIKSPLAQSTWLELYKKFVHPAGFYIAGSVQTDVEAIGTLLAPISDSAPVNPVITSSVASALIAPFTQLTALYDSDDGTSIRVNLDEKISRYQSLTATQLKAFYANVEELITPNSFTFDDDLGTGIGGSNFTYNSYPREGDSAEDTTYFATDSAGVENIFFLKNTFAPYDGLNTFVDASNAGALGRLFIDWNQDPDSAGYPLAQHLLGTPTETNALYVDSSRPEFDANNFVNPDHLDGINLSNSSERSTRLPGLLIKGSALTPATPDFYYRVDSDAYYYDDDIYPAGSFSSTIGSRFSISKLRWLGNDSEGVPDMSMTLETMDNEQFDSSFNS